MFDFFKKNRTEQVKTPASYTFGEDRGGTQDENLTLDGVKIDRDTFAKVVEKHIGKTGVDFDEQMLEQLTDYYEMVVRSNANINLTAITDAEEFAIKHIIDSLMLSPFIENYPRKMLMDVGTGAGMPAIPLAITHPAHKIAVIEALNKRYEFVKFACGNINVNNIAIGRFRAEEAGHRVIYREKFDFATARAVAPLNVLTEYCMPMVKMGGSFLAMKGANYKEELDAAENAIFQLGGRLEGVTEYKLPNGEARAVIEIKKVVPCRRELPRNSGAIKRKPF